MWSNRCWGLAVCLFRSYPCAIIHDPHFQTTVADKHDWLRDCGQATRWEFGWKLAEAAADEHALER